MQGSSSDGCDHGFKDWRTGVSTQTNNLFLVWLTGKHGCSLLKQSMLYTYKDGIHTLLCSYICALVCNLCVGSTVLFILIIAIFYGWFHQTWRA